MLRSVRVWCCLAGSVPGAVVGRPVRRCGLFPEGSVEVVLESLGCLVVELFVNVCIDGFIVYHLRH